MLDFDENLQTMRIIETNPNFEIIEIRKKKFKDRKMTSKEQGQSSLKQNSEKNGSSSVIETDRNSNLEIGDKTTPLIKIYCMSRIVSEENICIVLLEYDLKTKTMVNNNYIIFAVGEKRMEQSEELKLHLSDTGSLDSNNLSSDHSQKNEA